MIIPGAVGIALASIGAVVGAAFTEGGIDTQYGLCILIAIAGTVITFIFSTIMECRTEYGTNMLGKIRGFRRFLDTAEKPKLEALVMENPMYFYNILPYTFALGVSKKWMDKFADIAMQPPQWYGNSNAGMFNMVMFNSFMTSAMRQATLSAVPPSDSGGGGGFSGGGGGFSGGGGGGGGGGAW